jgi:hypothetical protein
MNNKGKVLAGMLTVILLAAGFYVNAQDNGCIVKLPGISGTYSGDCKNGLAEGRGVAQGIDKYYGQFNDGLPDGKGTYTWADGTYYEGQWKNGLKEGKGKMVYKDSTVSGYWKYDKYVGEKVIPPYKITRSMSVTRSSFTRLPGPSNYVTIKLTRGGNETVAEISDFTIAYSSGEEYYLGPTIGIQNAIFPLDVIVRFRAWNYFHTVQYDVQFEFVINEPATWEVKISY